MTCSYAATELECYNASDNDNFMMDDVFTRFTGLFDVARCVLLRERFCDYIDIVFAVSTVSRLNDIVFIKS
jgi:hypothetical protein